MRSVLDIKLRRLGAILRFISNFLHGLALSSLRGLPVLGSLLIPINKFLDINPPGRWLDCIFWNRLCHIRITSERKGKFHIFTFFRIILVILISKNLLKFHNFLYRHCEEIWYPGCYLKLRAS
ncbi:unnamed protein product [Moneuplotes crassus]|uniref:Uncharacterized protein n=1 Tax=Euplotes crassus TaxID=5936 RepID=A0AAD1XPQ7_EUPCR|nr:unnamed protein product [Moneuplotes crassus]